ncbi:MAG: hypothetical protein ACI97A_002045 [Planctomycetota bacterium]|jgi:hypothetical protein
MHMPSPNEHHQKLARVAGTWQGTEKMFPSDWTPGGSECEAITISRLDLADFIVITNYRQMREGQTTYAEHGVYSIEHQSQDVLLH